MADQNQDISVRVAQYRQIRDKIAEIKEELSKPKAALEQLGGILDAFLIRTGQESAKTSAGTFFRSTRFTAAVKDPQAFMDHVIHSNNWDLIGRHANPTAVKGYVEQNKGPVPGVELNAIATLNVRAPTGKAKSKLNETSLGEPNGE